MYWIIKICKKGIRCSAVNILSEALNILQKSFCIKKGLEI